MASSRETSQLEGQGACSPPPEAPKLCINNCGFFGLPENNFLCSVCFKKSLKASVEEATLSLLSNCSISDARDASCGEPSATCGQPSLPCAEPSSIRDAQPDPALSTSSCPTPLPKPNRCFSCHKRVGLTGFRCRCGNVFCSGHRHSDQHDCSFDFKAAARDMIAKANPVMKADKLNRI